MSKKDYTAIAKVINGITEELQPRECSCVSIYESMLVARLSWYFAEDNINFNSAVFRAACYGKREDNE